MTIILLLGVGFASYSTRVELNYKIEILDRKIYNTIPDNSNLIDNSNSNLIELFKGDKPKELLEYERSLKNNND